MRLSAIEIRNKADLLLQCKFDELFTDNNFQLIVHNLNNQDDRGIDFIFELIERANQKTWLKFNVQNKGVEISESLKKIKRTKKLNAGKISFTLKKIRHVNYYRREIGEPIVITVCDLESKKIYWYPIQLDLNIEDRAREQIENRVESIQIYIDPSKVVSQNTFHDFINDLRQSKLEQNVDYNYTEDYGSQSITFQQKHTDKSEISKFALNLDVFRHFSIVPKHILASIHPISKEKSDQAYFHGSNLYTSNNKLYEELRLIVSNFKTKGIPLTQEAITLIHFLEQNLFYHIESTSHDDKSKVCLHDLVRKETCNCEKCSYDRLDFTGTIKAIQAENGNEDIGKRIKKGFIQFKLGLFGEAFQSFHSIAGECYNKKIWDLRFICLYNLKKLRNHVKTNYFVENRLDIIKKIDRININAEYEKIKPQIDYDLQKIISWIFDDKFIYRAFYRIEAIVSEIIKKFDLDQRGGWSSDRKYHELIVEFAHISSFIEHNYIVFEEFSEYNKIVLRTFEGVLAATSFKNDSKTRDSRIDEYLLDKVLIHCNSEDILALIEKYQIASMKLHEIDYQIFDNSLAANIQRLASSMKDVFSVLKYERGENNYHLIVKIRKILSNSLILFSYVEYSQLAVSQFFNSFISVFLRQDEIKVDHKYFNHFVFKKKNLLLEQQLIDLMNYLSGNPSEMRRINVFNLVYELRERNSNGYQAIVDNMITLNLSLDRSRFIENMETYISLFDFLSEKPKEYTKKYIVELLLEKFNPHLYFISAINGVIDYRPMFQDFIGTIPKMENQSSFREIFTGEKDFFNHRLNELLEICYKFSIPLEEIRHTIPPPSLYYEWLYDPESFNYVNFEPSWILEYPSSIFFERFSSIYELKELTKNFLKKNRLDRLNEIYFEYFA